jgi:hypothetical protein
VARKTVVWYQYRTQAETAETIAIGLEQPKHNKAKRYKRLDEQPFPVAHKPLVPQPRRQAHAEVVQVPREDRCEYQQERPGALPTWWPEDMWCRAWWDDNVNAVGGASGHFDDTIEHLCHVADPYDMLAHLMSAERERSRDATNFVSRCWVQRDMPGSPLGAKWYGGSASAHCVLGPFNSLTPDTELLQRTFLDALLQSGRCISIRAGNDALAAGFADEVEAQVTGAVLHSLGWGHGEASRYADAILAQSPGTAEFRCPDCGNTEMSNRRARPQCPGCNWPMMRSDEDEIDHWALMEGHAKNDSICWMHPAVVTASAGDRG